MNEQLKKLPLNKIIDTAKRFRLIIIFTLFAGIYIYLFIFISSLEKSKPPQTDIDQEIQTIKRLNVDEKAVEQMLLLTEENIEIKTLYEEARNNPFSE